MQKNSLSAYKTPTGHGGSCGLPDIREVLYIGFLKPKRFHTTDGKQNLKNQNSFFVQKEKGLINSIFSLLSFNGNDQLPRRQLCCI